MPTDQDYKFGRLAVSSGLLKQEKLEECIEILVALEQVGSRQRLWDVLARKGHMSEDSIAMIRAKAEGNNAVHPVSEVGDETAMAAPPVLGLPKSYSLAHLSGQGHMTLFPLPKRMLTIGSGSTNDIVLSERDVSDCQARMRFASEQFVIEDSGSGSGIRVNDRPVLRQVLNANDLIQVSSAMLLVLAEYDGAAPEPVNAADVNHMPLARLRFSSGPRKGTTFFLGEQPLVIGRHPLANARVEDAAVSEFHAQITCAPGAFVITDLNSATGTRVGGIRKTKHSLRFSEAVSIGPVSFTIELLTDDSAISPSSSVPAAEISTGPAVEAPQEDDWKLPSTIEVEPATDPLMRDNVKAVRADPADARKPLTVHPGELRLSCVAGPLEGKRYRLKHHRTIIGRDAEAGIRIEDASVSRRHAEVAIHDGIATVRDLGSRNGIFINGKRVARADLCSGDAIRVGKCLFIAEAAAEKPKQK